jgi:hypothetical protein
MDSSVGDKSLFRSMTSGQNVKSPDSAKQMQGSAKLSVTIAGNDLLFHTLSRLVQPCSE